MKFLGLLIFLFALSGNASACLMIEELQKEDLEKSDLEFLGKAEELVFAQGKPGQVRFSVEKVLKGKYSGKTIEVFWMNGNFGEPSSLEEFQKKFGKRSRVGIILPETIRKNTKCVQVPRAGAQGAKASRLSCDWIVRLPLPFPPSEEKQEKPWVLSKVCSNSFIFKADN